MFNRVMLVAVLGMLILCLAGCGGEEKKSESAPQPAPAPKPEEKVPGYGLTKEDLTTHKRLTSRNVSIPGGKLGAPTLHVVKGLFYSSSTPSLPECDATV